MMTTAPAPRATRSIRVWVVDNRHLAAGSLAIMGSTVFSSVAGWAYWALAAHHWSRPSVGVSLSTVSALSIIGLLAGQPFALSISARLTTGVTPWRVMRHAVVVTALLGIILGATGLALLPRSLLDGLNGPTKLLFLAGSLMAPLSIVLDAASLVVRITHWIVLRTLIHSVGKLVVLAAIAYGVVQYSGTEAVLASWVGAQVVANGMSALRLRSVVPRVGVPNGTGTREILWKGIGPQVLGTWAASVPPQVLPIVVIGSLGATQAGWFSLTWLLGGVCFMISPSVSQVLLAEGARRERQLSASLRSAVSFSLLLLAPPIMLFLVAGRPLLNLFSPGCGQAGSSLLIVLALSALPDLVTNIAVAVYRIRERLVMVSAVNGVIAIVTVAGAEIAVRRHSLLAVSLSWGTAQLCGCLVVLGDMLIHRVRAGRGQS